MKNPDMTLTHAWTTILLVVSLGLGDERDCLLCMECNPS